MKAIPIHISFTRVVASQFSAITRVAAIGVISGLKRTDVAAAIRLCINAPKFELADSSELNRVKVVSMNWDIPNRFAP